MIILKEEKKIKTALEVLNRIPEFNHTFDEKELERQMKNKYQTVDFIHKENESEHRIVLQKKL